MGHIINERLDYIGRIDDNGYIFDSMGNCFAQITDSGYITEVAGWNTYGKIEEDGTIKDASMNVIGRIQADGYVYIHSTRVCKVSSAFIEKITPGAWNAGQPSTYGGRSNTHTDDTYQISDTHSFNFLFSPFFLNLVIGIILGVIAIENNWGGIEMLVAAPICVLLFSLMFKIINFFY